MLRLRRAVRTQTTGTYRVFRSFFTQGHKGSFLRRAARLLAAAQVRSREKEPGGLRSARPTQRRSTSWGRRPIRAALLEGIMERPKRKHPRLKEYDYSQNGAYYVTICVEGHQCLLGRVDDNKNVQLSDIGEIVKKYIEMIESHYEYVRVVNYVVMPNHVHLLIQKDIPPQVVLQYFDGNDKRTASLETIIHAFKRFTTKEIGHSIWQTSFYDHIIRNSADIQRVSDYIDANPRRWRTDKT